MKSNRTTATIKSNRTPATITQVPGQNDGYYWIITTDDGDRMFLSGTGAPKEGAVGDKGFVTYQSGSSYGRYCWSAT